jgi:Ca-activated chloride channel family protein
MMKQILLITDGCSNVGVSPIVAAANAREEGITVNVVGVVDQGAIGELGAAEIAQIARAGGGMDRIVQSHQLSHTIQMMTRKTVVQTIQHAVNRELRQILHSDANSIEDLPPEQRSQVVQVMDELTETSELKVALLIDASASMKPKLQAVEEAIRDLMLSLQAREGKSEIAVFHFPGRASDETVMDLDWTQDLSNVRSMFQRMQMRGATPTGPAIFKVIEFYQYDKMKGSDPALRNRPETDGMLGDYVV